MAFPTDKQPLWHRWEHFLSAPGVLRTPRLLAILSYLLIKSYYRTGTEPPVSLDRNLITSEGRAPLCHPICVTPCRRQASRFTPSDSLLWKRQRGRVDAAIPEYSRSLWLEPKQHFGTFISQDFMLLSGPRRCQQLQGSILRIGGCV